MEWKNLMLVAKLLILWSGRRGSNPRRPAWEIDHRLQIQTLASTASTDGDRNTPSINDLLHGTRKWSKNGAKEISGTLAIVRQTLAWVLYQPTFLMRE
jgi:hypothetical protein